MTQDRDPFELLPRFVDPEPDPVTMNATIAQSREAFLRAQGRAVRHPPESFSVWVRQSVSWLIPAGAGAVALVAAVVVAPSLTPTTPLGTPDEPVIADQSDARTPDQPIQAEPAVPTGTQGGGVRMGMQPAPGQAGAGTSVARERTIFFDGADIRVETRMAASTLELYLPDIAPDTAIDSQVVLTGEDVSVVGAFQTTDSDIVAIQLSVNDEAFWSAYRPVDGIYTRDADLTALISDAADEAEARQRLADQ